MQNKTMAECIAFFGRYDLPQLHLNFFRILFGQFRILLIFHKTDPVREPDAVRIRHNRRFAEDISNDKIRALSADPRQRQELFEGLRDPVLLLLVQHPHARRNVPGFARPKAARAHDFLDLFRFRLRQRLH